MATINNTTVKKETKAQKFARLLALNEVKADPTLVEFINHEIDLLNKKNSSDKKPTKNQVANEELKSAIYNGMAENRLYSISEIQKEIPGCEELANQKISALLRQMIPGRIKRIEDKRKPYFQKVVEG